MCKHNIEHKENEEWAHATIAHCELSLLGIGAKGRAANPPSGYYIHTYIQKAYGDAGLSKPQIEDKNGHAFHANNWSSSGCSLHHLL